MPNWLKMSAVNWNCIILPAFANSKQGTFEMEGIMQ